MVVRPGGSGGPARVGEVRRFERRAAMRPWRIRLTQPEDRSEPEIHEGQRAGNVLERDTRFRRALAVADVAAAALALSAGILVAGANPRIGLFLGLPLVVLVNKLGGLYDRDENVLRKTTLDEAPTLLQTGTLYTLLAWLGSAALATHELGHAAVVAIWGVLLVAELALRAIARRLVLMRTPAERCLVLGDREAAERVLDKFSVSHSLKAELVGRVRMTDNPREKGGPTELGPLGDLDYIVRAHRIDRVIIAPNARDSDETLDTIRLVKALGVKVSVLPRLFEVVGSSVEFDDVDGITLLGVRRYGLTTSSAFVKRSADVCASTLLMLLLAPVLVAFAIAIKLGSRGPVLFRQQRIGRGSERFTMLKFRTMYDGADEAKEALLEQNEAKGLFKIRDDPRVTPVGRLLRRCALDELPQLFNVLRGEMSLVGPRPLIPEEDCRIEGLHRRRLEISPGMTGVWQVLGSSTRLPLHEMVKVDYIYAANWSLWLDIKILLRTVPLVLLRRGV